MGCVIYWARSTTSFFLALAIAAIAPVVMRFVIVTNYPPRQAVFTVLALAFWSSIGWGIRALLRRRERARLKALLARQN